MCCGLKWGIRVLGCRIYVRQRTMVYIVLQYLCTVGNSGNQQKCTMGYNDILWDRRNDLGKGAVIILNMSDGVSQFADILVNFEFSSDRNYV